MLTVLPKLSLPLQACSDVSWTDLSGAEQSLAIAEISSTYQHPLLVITENQAQANQLAEELRFFSKPHTPIAIFNDWETLPYDHFSPHKDIISVRLHLLQQLLMGIKGIYIVAANTLLQRLAPSAHIEAHSLVIAEKDPLSIQQLREKFIRCGYQLVEQVMQPGEFALRGSIMDVFPMGNPLPYRIDFFDVEIDSIRTFNPDTQRSEQKIARIEILPAREFPLDENAISLFRQQWRQEFEGNPMNCPMYQDISQGISSNGIEYFLPLFFECTSSLLDYLPQNTLIIHSFKLPECLQQYWQDIETRYQQRRYDTTRPLLTPDKAFFAPAILLQQLKNFKLIQLTPALPVPQFLINSASLENFLTTQHKRTLFTAESLGHRERLIEQLSRFQLHLTLVDNWQQFLKGNMVHAITVARLAAGCELDNLIIIAEAQLTGEAPQIKRKSTTSSQDASNIIRNLSELALGEAIVHVDHGVGRYQGLSTINDTEFVTIEYANQNKLYVPVTSLHLISRYGGLDSDLAPLNSLGNEQWLKSREKAAKRAYDVATELLEIHAHRAHKPGFKFNLAQHEYQQFANRFPFELTADQEKAITQVITDMSSERAMDRLICGDVGFGKTEVAMRAAFIAVQNNKQVAVLVPTTLLAQQHYETFKNRFVDTAVSIAVISRFSTSKQQAHTLQQLADGKIDIIIGTHKLIQQQIKFSNLGLLIIDEEHRFGVRQKEKIKALRAEIDILTLTATPIPRTLNMALSDVRDLSIICTPPAKRLAVKTFVHQHDTSIVREAIMREIMRGGQVFYLHNSVDTIEQRARELRELLPEAKIAIAHGQMPETQLEKVMADFYHQRCNVLVCTTIIENGIDIPSANTIVIERADKLGLAQLHQLRGRVGRSHHQAYAYLLIPHKNLLTRDAEKRLDAISALEDLGIGFTLATHDLEIRGAGELLGDEQSGHIQDVGFSLYMELLERAVESIKSGQQINFDQPFLYTTEISLSLPTLIPENYLPDVHARLILYKRIANARTSQELDDLQIEMIDRFGLLPEPTKNLFAITELKLQAEKLGIHKVAQHNQWITLNFDKQPNIDPLKIIQLIQQYPDRYKMEGGQRLRVQINDKNLVNLLQNLFLQITIA